MIVIIGVWVLMCVVFCIANARFRVPEWFNPLYVCVMFIIVAALALALHEGYIQVPEMYV